MSIEGGTSETMDTRTEGEENKHMTSTPTPLGAEAEGPDDAIEVEGFLSGFTDLADLSQAGTGWPGELEGLDCDDIDLFVFEAEPGPAPASEPTAPNAATQHTSAAPNEALPQAPAAACSPVEDEGERGATAATTDLDQQQPVGGGLAATCETLAPTYEEHEPQYNDAEAMEQFLAFWGLPGHVGPVAVEGAPTPNWGAPTSAGEEDRDERRAKVDRFREKKRRRSTAQENPDVAAYRSASRREVARKRPRQGGKFVSMPSEFKKLSDFVRRQAAASTVSAVAAAAPAAQAETGQTLGCRDAPPVPGSGSAALAQAV